MNLDAIEARAKAATPGPWRVTLDFGDPGEIHGPDGEIDLYVFYDGPQITYDGEFITHAREDIPALTAEVRRLKAQLETEILRRDSLGETLDNVVADHKRDIARLADIKAKAKSILVHSYPGNSTGEGCIRTEYLDALATALEGE